MIITSVRVLVNTSNGTLFRLLLSYRISVTSLSVGMSVSREALGILISLSSVFLYRIWLRKSISLHFCFLF